MPFYVRAELIVSDRAGRVVLFHAESVAIKQKLSHCVGVELVYSIRQTNGYCAVPLFY